MSLHEIRQQIVRCERCPRLRAYCSAIATEKKRAFFQQTYWGRPVPGFGDPDARLLIIGLAPAAHGANRTGRVFTGDGSGDFLMTALFKTGFANIPTSRHPDDGLTLSDAYIVSAVRCAPPDNKPRPEEIVNCFSHLAAELASLSRVKVIVALGRIAFEVSLRLLESSQRPKPTFTHGAHVRLGPGRPDLLASYHPSRQNTNTGKLTARMFEQVFRRARSILAIDDRLSP